MARKAKDTSSAVRYDSDTVTVETTDGRRLVFPYSTNPTDMLESLRAYGVQPSLIARSVWVIPGDVFARLLAMRVVTEDGTAPRKAARVKSQPS